MPHVFISHSHADAPKVEELGQRLKDAGLSPWISAEQLERGGAFSPQLSRAIASADAVVYVHTNRAASRYWVTAELHYALRNAVPIVVLEYDRLHESSEIAFILAGSTERIRRAGQSAREFFSAARAAIKKVQRKRAPALAVWNAKGGVGKTSIAANLALCLAAFEKLQKRVLLIDLDPQHNLTGC